jgi:gamma-D-glutamyl-L-lysine dipeptidyl-peptidase
MEFGISLLSALPVRALPDHKSEMVSQVLFGELFRILQKEMSWIRIRLSFDDYEGWIDSCQVAMLDEPEFIRLLNEETPSSLDLVQLLSNDSRKTILPIVLGSSLPGLSDQHFRVKDQMFSFDGLVSETRLPELASAPHERINARHNLVEDSMLYLNAPYLWGGRSPFGIDCSGFVQMVYKLNQVKLPRDASQQAGMGEPVNFVSEAEPGDLAFFDNEEGTIIHVGLVMDKNRIIHASGKVRIDTLDHEGIYNESEKKYTHRLRVIKRII